MAETRRFDGKRYALVRIVKQKRTASKDAANREAGMIAAKLRARGKSARVTKVAEGYAIYARGNTVPTGRTRQTVLGKNTSGKVGGTKDFAYRLIRKSTGQASYYKGTATGKVALFNFLRAKYHNSASFIFGGVYTPNQFTKIAWDEDHGGLRSYIRPAKYKYTGYSSLPTQLKHDLIEKVVTGDRSLFDTGDARRITLPVAKDAVKAAGIRWKAV